MGDVVRETAALERLRVQWGPARATGIMAGPRPLRVLRDGGVVA